MTKKNWCDRLLSVTQGLGNTLCLGLDPDLERIPLSGSAGDVIKKFYLEILNELIKNNLRPAAIKPNLAFYEAIGFESLHALMEILPIFRKEGILIILDGKRGDIGKTSKAYAKSLFSRYGADAATVAPYMGFDSVKPFLDYSPYTGTYLLVRTSNSGSEDFQDLLLSDGKTRLYEQVARKAAEWGTGNLGAVIGATYPQEMENIFNIWASLGKELPCLIPGLSVSGVKGEQGGSLESVFQAIANGGSNPWLHLLNSSSGLSYAWESDKGVSFPKATANAVSRFLESAAKFY